MTTLPGHLAQAADRLRSILLKLIGSWRVARHDTEQTQQNHRADEGDQQAPQIKARRTRRTEYIEQEPSDGRAYDSYEDVHQNARTGVHDHACQPTSQRADNNPREPAHNTSIHDISPLHTW